MASLFIVGYLCVGFMFALVNDFVGHEKGEERSLASGVFLFLYWPFFVMLVLVILLGERLVNRSSRRGK